MAEVAYVHTKGTHLEYVRSVDQVPANELGPGNALPLAPYPQYTGIGAYLFDGESTYDAFQFQIQKKASHGISFAATWTLSKAMDNCAYDHTSAVGCPWQIAQDPQEMWGVSQLDAANRVTGQAIYQLPQDVVKSLVSGRGKSVLNGLVGGWQVSPIFNGQGGVPFTPTTSGTNLSNSLAGTWLPNRIGSGILSSPSIHEWFNPAAFVAAPAYTFGNSGRDILRGPGFWDFDFALAKNFPLKFLGEGSFLQVRADSYDLFNHPDFSQPASSIGALGVGVITSALTSRIFQLGARIEF